MNKAIYRGEAVGHWPDCALHEDNSGYWCVECHHPIRMNAGVCPVCKITPGECERLTVSELAKCACDEIDLALFEEAQERAYEERREAAMWGD